MSDIKKNIQRNKHNVLEGRPNKYEGRNGEITYRKVDGAIVQYVKESNEWKKMSSTESSFDKIENNSSDESKRLTIGLVSTETKDFIKKDGSRDFTGNQSFGGNNITNVGNLDVDGTTTLDRVTIDTTDGPFAVSGANSSFITTTGSGLIRLTSATEIIETATSNMSLIAGNDIDITPTNDLDIDANNITVDTTRQYTGTHAGNVTTTGSANITTEATGSAANTVSVKNTNSHNSSFTGVHLKTDSGTNTSNSACFNKILIEASGVATKSADYGVDIRSSNQIRIRAENTQPSDGSGGYATGLITGMLIRATGNLQIGGGTDDITTDASSPLRIIVDGIFETPSLYRPTGQTIATDIDVMEGNSSANDHVKFEAINTDNLVKNFTYKAKNLNVTNGSYFDIVSSSDIENTIGTMYLITVGLRENTNSWQNVAICSRLGLTEWQITTIGQSGSTSNYGTITAKGGGSGTGIRWQNNLGVTVQAYGTAQRIIEASDYP